MEAINVTPRIFLDMDGVLMDFDKSAGRLLHTDNIYKYEFVYGPEKFWEVLHSDPHFFADLEPMPDAFALWYAVRRCNPAVLTALPLTGADRVDAQKRECIREWFGSDVEVITCRTKDKPSYCRPGDVLVDDRAVNKPAWEAAGGRYIIHTSAADTIEQLGEMGVL
jgi:hypothetical protein